MFFLRSWTAIGTPHDRAARYSCMVVLLILPFIQRDTRREYININSSHKKAKPASRKKLLLTRLLSPLTPLYMCESDEANMGTVKLLGHNTYS